MTTSLPDIENDHYLKKIVVGSFWGSCQNSYDKLDVKLKMYSIPSFTNVEL